MDDTDRAILDHLRADSRAAFTDIADQLGVSEATVRSRVRQLEEDGTIEGFTVRVRGASVRALANVQVEVNVHSMQVGEAVLDLDGVEEVWELTGEYDLAVIAHADTTEQLNTIVDGIRRVDATRATRTSVILDELSPDHGARDA